MDRENNEEALKVVEWLLTEQQIQVTEAHRTDIEQDLVVGAEGGASKMEAESSERTEDETKEATKEEEVKDAAMARENDIRMAALESLVRGDVGHLQMNCPRCSTFDEM